MNRPEDFTFDTRIQKRMLAAGLLSTEALNKRVAALKDMQSASEKSQLEQPALVSVKEPEPIPASGLLGMGVPALSPLEPAPRVSALEPRGSGLRGLSAGLGPVSKVSPFEPAPGSGLHGGKVNPFEPAPLVSPYEPAPRVSAYEAPDSLESSSKVNPFEAASKISPFEASFGVSGLDPLPARSPAPVPAMAPYSTPAYVASPSSLGQSALSPLNSPMGPSLGASSLGHAAPLVSPFEPSLGSPFEPAPRVPAVAPVSEVDDPSGEKR